VAEPSPAEVEAGVQALGKLLPGWRGAGRLDPLAAAVLRAVLPDRDARVRADERTQVAEEIRAHADEHYPTDGCEAQRTARRHLLIAARVALDPMTRPEILAALPREDTTDADHS
jgi:hypothetical protein